MLWAYMHVTLAGMHLPCKAAKGTRHSTPGNAHAPHQAARERHSGAERAMLA